MNCTRATLILSLALALSAVGCGSNNGGQSDTGHPAGRDASPLIPADATVTPGPDAQAIPPDAQVEPGPDAAVPGPDAAAPPARVLVPAHLLGDTPVENRLLDPDMNNLGMWFFYMVDDYSIPTYYRPVVASSPAGLPILRIEEGGSTAGVVAASFAVGGTGPFTASIWLGQPAKTAKLETLSAQLQALDGKATDTGSTSFDLLADDSTSKTLGDIRWTQFTAKINTEILGWAVLAAVDTSGSTLYVTAPVLLEDKAKSFVDPKRGRPLTRKEHEILKRVVDDARRRMPLSERLLHKPKRWPTQP
jgi:hypothetical protein